MRIYTLAIRVQLPLVRNTYSLFNSDFGNLVWKTNDGEVGSIILLFLLFGGCFDCRCVMVVGLGRKVSFLFLFLVLLKEMRIRVSPTPSLVFTLSGTFTEVMEGIFKVNANEDVEDMNLRDFFQDTSTTPSNPSKSPLTSTIHSTKSLFLHTTQLQTKTIPKRRTQPQNHNSKVHQPNIHELTTHHNCAIHCSTET